MLTEGGNVWAKKNPQKPHKQSILIKVSQTKFPSFLASYWWDDIWYGATYKVIQSFRARFEKWQGFGQHLLQKGPGKKYNFFAEMLITTIEFFKNHFYNQGLTFFWLFKVTQPVEHVKWIKLNSI